VLLITWIDPRTLPDSRLPPGACGIRRSHRCGAVAACDRAASTWPRGKQDYA